MTEINIPESLDFQPFIQTWLDYCQYRKQIIKKPISQFSAKIIFNKFLKWKYTPEQATESLEQSMEGTWTGVFEVHKNKREGRLDGKIYLWKHNGKEEISDEKYDQLKLKYKGDLVYSEDYKCFFIKNR